MKIKQFYLVCHVFPLLCLREHLKLRLVCRKMKESLDNNIILGKSDNEQTSVDSFVRIKYLSPT